VFRSVKRVDGATGAKSMGRRWWPPDPGLGAAGEPGGGNRSSLVDLLGVGERLPGERFAAEQPPPRFLEIEPRGSFGDVDGMHAGAGGEPLLDRRARVAGEVVAEHVETPQRIGLIQRDQQLPVPRGVARRCRQRPGRAIAPAQRAVAPDLIRAAAAFQQRVAPVPIGRPARGRWECARSRGRVRRRR